MRLAIMAGCAMLSAAALADGQQAAQPAAAPAPQAQAAPGKDKLICRMMYHQGSVFRTQQCHTQQEWDQERARAQRSVSEFQNRNYVTSGR